ncbi:copper chaperone PCu(A)C [Phenylobacterium sp.]|uniref:copper chaperone PCu(A)C n=1 Tax=Phenylobacterium sp. TaxID=1871053 RepID=UPI002CB906F8|nr:copper chaperone PCu(A)C [Phenylobacterium sp.]HLZ76557.1 copper chaperone PCu(A)C [Phenylobacterium sp.]
MKPLLFALSLVGAAAALAAAQAGPAGVQVLRPWSRPAVEGTNAIGYMVLANRGRRVDVLEKVESPVAASVEMHESAMAGGVMSMKPVQMVSAPPGGQVTFGPGAYHLMFIGVKRTLKAGDQVPATLSFASGARLKVSFAVTSGLPPT